MFQLSLLRDSLLKILQILNMQIHFCVGATSFPFFHMWKKTELHIPVNTSW
jgi:hypothetical protein